MNPSKKLVTAIAKFHGVDTALFEHEAEWDLAAKIYLHGISQEDLQSLELLAAKL